MTNISALALGVLGLAAAAPSASAQPAPSVTGRWLVTEDVYGVTAYSSFDLAQDGEALSGDFDGDKLSGSIRGPDLRFTSTDRDGGTAVVQATLARGVLTGSVLSTDAADKEHPQRYSFTAIPRVGRPQGPATRHEFTPVAFHRKFSALTRPVLTIAPGDGVHTTTVDAGGVDGKGVQRVLGGNPQTGPFYVASAAPGDTLVVHIVRLRLNRDYAVSDDAIVPRGLSSGLAVRMKDAGKTVRWHIDLAKGLASLDRPGAHTAGFSLPVRPMIGCVAVAPPPMRGEPNTNDSGSYGGNMDFNGMVEGATLYLPVFVPGALLYLGDAHAVQGDGELTGNALETSADVEFTVDVIPGKAPLSPRLETDGRRMAMGFGGSIDVAFQAATANMAGWLADDYGLTPSEIASVMGPGSEYRVSEVADRNAGVVVMLDKALLAGLKPEAKK